jgi:hypothetical protein
MLEPPEVVAQRGPCRGVDVHRSQNSATGGVKPKGKPASAAEEIDHPWEVRAHAANASRRQTVRGPAWCRPGQEIPPAMDT